MTTSSCDNFFRGKRRLVWRLRLHTFVLLYFVLNLAVAFPLQKNDLPQHQNVDQILTSAHRAARDQRFDEAQKLAELVVQEAPDCLDAYMLLARLAAWQEDYETGLKHLDSIFVREPQYRPALLLKLEIFIWAEKTEDAEKLLEEFFAAGYEGAYFTYRQAQLERQQFQHFRAYVLAKQTLELDPFHAPSRDLVKDTRFAKVFVNHDFEYYDFPEVSTSLSGIHTVGKRVSLVDPALRFGYATSVTAQAWPRSILSFSLINHSIYRYKTVNNRLGFELIYRPIKYLDLTFRTFWGAPARVIPKNTFFISAYTRFSPWLDSTLSLSVDILPWPTEEPAVISTPALNVGFFIKQYARLAATYRLGVMNYCGKNEIMHSAQIGGEVTIKKFSFKCYYGYGEENDKSDTSLVAPGTCASFEIFEQVGYKNTMFGLIGINIHTFGLLLAWQALEKLNLRLGYHPQFRLADSNDIVLPAHIISLGGSYDF